MTVMPSERVLGLDTSPLSLGFGFLRERVRAFRRRVRKVLLEAKKKTLWVETPKGKSLFEGIGFWP